MMRIEILKDLLEQALQIALLAVSKDVGQVTSTVRVDLRDRAESGGGVLSLTTTDGTLMTCVPVGAQLVHGDGAFAVEAKRLSDWLSNVEGERVDIDVTEEGADVECGDARAFFAVLDADAFPKFDRTNARPVVSGPVEPFAEGLSFVRTAIGKETSNNERANQYQIAEYKDGRFFASDTHVIAIYDTQGVEELGSREGEALKVGRAELPKLARFLKLSSVDTFSCERTDSMFFVTGDDESVFGYAVPQFEPAAIPGLRTEVTEPEVWTAAVEDLRRALAALDATRAASDHALTLAFPDVEEGGEAQVVLSVQDVTGQQSCTVSVSAENQTRHAEGPVKAVTHIEWLQLALGRFAKGELRLGVSLQGAKYLKFHQTDGACVRATLVGLRSV